MNQARLARVLRNMERDGLTQIVISSTASVYYLTGYWVEPMERMLALYIRADGTCRLFANALFALEPQEGLELVLHQDSDEPTAALAASTESTEPMKPGDEDKVYIKCPTHIADRVRGYIDALMEGAVGGV